MPVPSTIADISTTASLNSPAGSDNLSTTDDYLRAIQAIVKTQDNLNARKGANSDITSLTGLSGNLTFTGTGNRITGDFTSATLANRVMFQTSTVNGNTQIVAIPNGTAALSAYNAYNNSDPTNCSIGQLRASAAEVAINSSIAGTGTYLPMTFYTGGSERMRVDTSGNVIYQSTGSALSNIASINGGQLAGFRNKIINGNMGIYQRGTAAVTTNGGYGPADRYKTLSIGNTFSTTQGSFVSGDTLFDTGGAQYFTQVAVTSVAGAGNYTILQQQIEDVRLLAGQTVTVSFWAKALAGTPSIGVGLVQVFGTGGSTAVALAGQAQALSTTWAKYTKTFTVPSISGKTIGTEATHATNLNFWLDAGSTWDSQSGSIGQSSKTVSIAQVQLEEGSVATPFEHRPYQTELALCQRYYYRTPLGIDAFCSGSNENTVATVGAVNFPVPMRIQPTALEQTGTAANYQIYEGSSVINCSVVPVFLSSGTTIAFVRFQVASGLTVGRATILRAVVGVGYLGWSAEL